MPSTSTQNLPLKNRLLTALPDSEYQRIAPFLKPIDLPLGRVLYEEGAHIERVYFLNSGASSSVIWSENGMGIEIGIIGREGAVGTEMALDSGTSVASATMQIKGEGRFLPADIFMEEFKRGGALHDLSLRHLRGMMTQTALCNRLRCAIACTLSKSVYRAGFY